MDSYLEEFQFEMLEDEKSINTVKTYGSDINQLIEFISGDILSIQSTDILNFKAWLRKQEFKAKTINRKLTAINRFIKFLNTYKAINLDITFKNEKVQSQEYLQEMLTMTDYKKLLGVAERANDYRAVAIFKTLYLTGMRVSELIQFRLSDVGKKKIFILGKGSKERRVIIPVELNKCLNQYQSKRKQTSSLLFTGVHGPISRFTVNDIIKKYARKAKVKLSRAHAHNFRHLYALVCIRERNITIDELADLLGHTDINTTRIYTRKTEDELMKIAEKFE